MESSLLLGLFTYGSIFGITWILYKMFIEPLLSPLRKLPGLSFHPIYGNMKEISKGQAMEATIKIVEEHGPLCRYYFMFGRERVLVADPDIAKQITVTNCKNYIKPPGRMMLMKKMLGDGLVMSEGAKHEQHKRLMSPSFNNSSIRRMLGVFEERFKKLQKIWMDEITSNAEKVGNIAVAADVCRNTLDIIGEIAFSYDFNSLENPEHEVANAFQRILQGTGLSWRFLIPYYFKFPFPDAKRLKNDARLMRGAVETIINSKNEALQQGKTGDSFKKDLLGMMMLAKDDSGEGMSKQELRDQVMTIMLAGHETTAQGISWAILNLAQNHEIQARVREEIRREWTDQHESLSWEMLESMTYTECVIKETLRMYPPVPLTLRQAVDDDTYKYDGEEYFIPKGTILMLSIGPMMRRPELFDEPNTFNPDRFFDGEIDKAFYKYMPFLIGSRMCLGYKFALMEMKMALAVLVSNMNFELRPGQEFKRQLKITMRPNPELELNATLVG